MGRPRKSFAEHEASGAFARNPARRLLREGELTTGAPIGEPPAGLTKGQLVAWGEIVSTCPAGVLMAGDRIVVRSAARLLALENAGKITVGAQTQLLKLLESLGMSPRGRNYVKIAPTVGANGATGNEFADC